MEKYVFPSPQWAEAYCSALNNDPGYREASKDWRWDMALVATNIPQSLISTIAQILGLPDPKDLGLSIKSGAIKLRLRNGSCLGFEYILELNNADPSILKDLELPTNVRIGAVEADYVLEADYTLWRDLALGKADPVASLLSGKIKVRRGNILMLIRYSSAATRMAGIISRVPTRFIE